MNFITLPYTEYERNLPQTGNHIVGQLIDSDIIVYQAFNSNIAEYAVQNQMFGGAHYSFTRMSWIKPNFLWMMYRAGWAMKENQEHILAVRIAKDRFEEILSKAVHSVFIQEVYGSVAEWKQQLSGSEIRLQWDPDHDPSGEKLDRRAIQLGLRGDTLRRFATEWIIEIDDITSFVRAQKSLIDRNEYDKLMVMKEETVSIADPSVRLKIQLD